MMPAETLTSYFNLNVSCMIIDKSACITRLHKPVTDWLKTLPHSSDGLNM